MQSCLALSLLVAVQITPFGKNQYLFPETLSVVEGKVESLVEDTTGLRGSHKATVRVTHVFAGPVPNNRTVEMVTADVLVGTAVPAYVRPKLQEGETLLFMTVRDKAVELDYALYHHPRFGRWWPIRKGRDAWYPDAVTLAKTLGEFEKLKDPGEQLKMLDAAARSASFDRSSWGAATLGKRAAGEPAALELLKKLLDVPAMPLDGQVALDYALLALPEVKWQDSDRRVEMMLGWVRREGTTERDAQSAYHYWKTLVSIRKSLKPDKQMALYREAVLARKFPIEAVRHATFYRVQQLAEKFKEDEGLQREARSVIESLRQRDNE